MRRQAHVELTIVRILAEDNALGEKDLVKLCASLDPVMALPVYVFCSLPDFILPDGLVAFCTVREPEGLTAVIEQADAHRLRLPYTYDSRLITLSVHSSLEAIGFIAVISRVLAQAGIPCNAIAGYCHDHIFVPVDRAEESMNLLKEIAAGARS
ncbi:ACT domain-containing protein [Paraburkholderia aspalathi]|uniref:ACT domain-containing protein n=1 Tax=Paraburkholderia aspalathi TaxID=1324617 RepID=UPI0038BDBA9A